MMNHSCHPCHSCLLYRGHVNPAACVLTGPKVPPRRGSAFIVGTLVFQQTARSHRQEMPGVSSTGLALVSSIDVHSIT